MTDVEVYLMCARMHTTAVSNICTQDTTSAVNGPVLDMAGTSACVVLSVTLFVAVATWQYILRRRGCNASGDAATCQ